MTTISNKLRNILEAFGHIRQKLRSFLPFGFLCLIKYFDGINVTIANWKSYTEDTFPYNEVVEMIYLINFNFSLNIHDIAVCDSK